MAKTLKSYRLDDATIALISELRNNLHVSTSSDVIRKAIVLLDKVQKNEVQGGELLLVSADGSKRSIIFT